MAVTRGRAGRCQLAHRDEVPRPAPVVKLPRRDRSVIETAREWARRLETGQAKNRTDLARQLGVTPAWVTMRLALLGLAPALQEFLVKTRDENGRISERRLRKIASLVGERDQLRALRKHLARAVLPPRLRT